MRNVSSPICVAWLVGSVFLVACADDGSARHTESGDASGDATGGHGGAIDVPPSGQGGAKKDAGAGGNSGASDASGTVGTGGAAAPDGALDGGSPEAAKAAADGGRADASGATDSGEEGGDRDSGGSSFVSVPGWSVRKRIHVASGDLVLEEVLSSFFDTVPRANRLQALDGNGAVLHVFDAPAGAYLSDFCRHPSGAISAILIDGDGAVSLVRLDRALTPLATSRLHDPSLPQDLPGVDAGVTDLFASSMATDAARIASVGEDVVAVVYSSVSSVIAYRATFASGAWSAPQRTLIEPPRPLTPLIPIGGSFDTFGAIVEWFRPSLDTDEDGNAYVAIWANAVKIRAHVGAFHDGLTPLPDPSVDSDVLLTRMNRDGTRAWSRVVGTVNEDEPYAIRARHGQVAVVGRSRRLPGFDNTFWDGFVSVSTVQGDLVGSRALTLNASSIFLSVDALTDGTWVLGGSDGWSQNPDGLSVVSFGTKLLLALPTFVGDPVRLPLPAGPRHNEIRTLFTHGSRIFYGGHEDGPVMHTGDSDPTQIHATGVLGRIDDSPAPP